MDKNTIGIIAILAFLIIGSCVILLLPEEEEPEDDVDDEVEMEEIEDSETSEDDDEGALTGSYSAATSVSAFSTCAFLGCS